jgi:hypothetical protein
MKLLSKRISQILKLALLYNVLIGGLYANVVSSDRFLIKILDNTVSLQDIAFQLRNLKALNCVYEDSLVVKYFEKSFIKELDLFVTKFPEEEQDIRRYLHKNAPVLKKTHLFFKMLRYSEDQKSEVSAHLTKLIRESTKENKCNSEVLYKNTLKTNFIGLIETELYLRARYGGQLKQTQGFDAIRPSIELFVESLDKQFTHEYFW